MQGPFLGYRLACILILSIGLMVADRYGYLSTPRYIVDVMLLPVKWVVDIPSSVTSWSSKAFASRDALLDENAYLKAQSLILQRKVQKLHSLTTENIRLRELLNASELINETAIVAELIGVDPDPFSLQLIINKGSKDGVYEGQALLDAYGLMGQVIQVGLYSSRVLLIADTSHAIPVQVNRNGVRAIAVGTGSLEELELIYVANTADIIKGDLLTSSGLGGRFPKGYPVAVVDSIRHDPGKPFAIIKVIPSAKLDKSRHVMLVVNDELVKKRTEETK